MWETVAGAGRLNGEFLWMVGSVDGPRTTFDQSDRRARNTQPYWPTLEKRYGHAALDMHFAADYGACVRHAVIHAGPSKLVQKAEDLHGSFTPLP